jgi:AcrR family transcriptional regulator
MPVALDKDRQNARRMEVARGAARVLARDGLARASMRAIADELGCTVGVLTHYFRDKDQLLLFVHQYVVGEIFGDALAAARSLPAPQRIEAILMNALPDNPERLERWKTWIALLGPTIRRGTLLPVEESENQRFLDELEKELKAAQSCGLLRDGVDPTGEPRAIMSFLDGIAVDTVLHPTLYPPATQRWLARRYLAGLMSESIG